MYIYFRKGNDFYFHIGYVIKLNFGAPLMTYHFDPRSGLAQYMYMIILCYEECRNQPELHILCKSKRHCVPSRDGLASSKSQIVCAPLRGKHDSAGKPDWIFFSLKSPIDFTVFQLRLQNLYTVRTSDLYIVKLSKCSYN